MRFIKRHWCLTLFVLVAAILAFHRPILRGVANGLVVDDAIENCDTLFVVSGDRNYAVAGELFAQKKVRQVALLQETMRPLVECRILESGTEKTRRAIIKRGVPAQAIFIAPGEIWNIWDIADRVRERLTAHPQERIALIADLLQTKRLRWTLARTLTDSELSRVRIHAIRDRRFDESNWWRNRLGIKDVVSTYLRHFYTVIGGRRQRFTPPAWRLDELEQRLLDGN